MNCNLKKKFTVVVSWTNLQKVIMVCSPFENQSPTQPFLVSSPRALPDATKKKNGCVGNYSIIRLNRSLYFFLLVI